MRTALFLLFSIFLSNSYLQCQEYIFPGEIEGKVKVSAISQEWGPLIWLIENGTIVKKGDVVAKMDTKRVQEKLDANKDDIDRMNEELKNKKKELEEAFKDEDVSISQVTLERDLAKVKWEIAKSGIYGIELSRIQADIINSEIALEKSNLSYLTTKKLYDKELEGEQSFQQAKMELESAEIDVKIKKIGLDTKKLDKTNLEILSKMDFDVKEIQLQKAEKNKLNRTQSIKFDIQKKEEAIVNLNDSIKKSETRLANLTLTAPADGIAKIRLNQGKLFQVGDRAGRGFAIVDILYTEKKKIIVKIEEKQILKFAMNDVAKIKLLDTGEMFSGTITRISNSPKDKNESLGPVGRRVNGYSGITVFEVEVSFDDPNSKYKFGFNTSVTFSKKGK